MRRSLAAAFLFFSSLNADAEWKPLPAPLLPIEERYPVDLDEANRRTIAESDDAPRNVQIFEQREIPWISLFLVAGALIFAFTSRKKELQKELSKEEKAKTIQEESLAALEALNASIGSLTPESFYVSLIQIFRSYIERYYGLPAETSTTEEFFAELQKASILDPEASKEMARFLESADRVKFARASASQEECLQAIKYAMRFIRHLA